MKEKIVNAALLVGSIIFCLLALEVGLRLAWAYKWDMWPLQNQFRNFRNFPLLASGYPIAFDAELGWIPKHQTHNPWGTAVTILEDGTRSNGSEEVPNLNGDILAVGDSYTFGDQVSDWETWPAQLEHLSGRRVINGGVFGYGIDQAFLRARQLLGRYRVNTLIFSFTPDDIHRCQLSEKTFTSKPYFDLSDGRLKLENVPVPPPARPKESKALIALEHSVLVHEVMQRLFPRWWAIREVQVHNKEKGTEIACELLHKLENLTQTSGTELIILAEYTRQDIFLDSVSMANEKVLSCLTAPATRILDLKPALLELSAQDPSRYNRLYKGGEGHMSAEGNRFVALEISKFLTRR
jgi:hypothetical protein